MEDKSKQQEISPVGNITRESAHQEIEEIRDGSNLDEYTPSSQQITPFETAISIQESNARLTGLRSFRLQDLYAWRGVQLAALGIIVAISSGTDCFLISMLDKMYNKKGVALGNPGRVGMGLAMAVSGVSGILALYAWPSSTVEHKVLGKVRRLRILSKGMVHAAAGAAKLMIWVLLYVVYCGWEFNLQRSTYSTSRT